MYGPFDHHAHLAMARERAESLRDAVRESRRARDRSRDETEAGRRESAHLALPLHSGPEPRVGIARQPGC
jgi:hypothetical protein